MIFQKFALALIIFSACALTAEDTLPNAAPPYYRVRYEPSTTPGELIFGVSYTVWVPPGVKTLRGLIVHQHGCGEGSCRSGQTGAFDLHWQALARKHDCALMSPSYEQPEKANCGMWCDPRNGSDKKFQQALNELGTQSQHPELASIPWALWGHSGGGVWVGTMVLLHPKRVACVWMRSGTPRITSTDPKTPPVAISSAVYSVPLMCNIGTKEGVTEKDGKFAKVWENNKPFFLEMRGKGALIGVAVDPNSSHDCGNSRYLAIPWTDACLTARLPEKAGDSMLKPMPADSAWLAPLLSGAVIPATKFTDDPKAAVWLPNEKIAKAYAEYIKDGNVSDTTPPPAPTNVTLNGNELTWSAEADLESGIGSFIIERDGAELVQVPAKPTGFSIGRPIFQRNGYSDSPGQPLADMRYIDATAAAGEKHTYRVITRNSVGLKSEVSKEAVSGR